MPNLISNFICSCIPSAAPANASHETAVPDTSIEVIAKNPSSTFMDKIRFVAEKVKEVALFVFKVAVSALLFWVNPSLFAIGFITGIIFDEQVREAIQKIKDVWNNQKVVGTLVGAIACGLSMPVTLAAASLLWSAHFGSLMTLDIRNPSGDGKTQMQPASASG